MLPARPRPYLVTLAFGLALLPFFAGPGGAAAADPAKRDKNDKKGKKSDLGKNVHFKTADGVELQGTFYANPTGKKDAVVLLLHDVGKAGNNSHVDGWDSLAEKLHDAGYVVFSFDFRGFGESKSVDTVKFWDFKANPQNGLLRVRVRAKMPETIDSASFPPKYYPFLLNDIAAAKAYLDRRNDARELNSSSLIVIGAGQGATLGAMWLAQEWHRRRATAIPLGAAPTLDDPEGKDQACAVWLTISPSLGRPGMRVPVDKWLVEAGVKNKVPMAFIYGSKDTAGRQFATNCLKALNPKGNKLEFTGPYGKTPTPLTGSKLLQKGLKIDNLIINTYLKSVMDARGGREWKKREADRFVYFWVLNSRNIPCKNVGEENTKPMTPGDALESYLMRRR